MCILHISGVYKLPQMCYTNIVVMHGAAVLDCFNGKSPAPFGAGLFLYAVGTGPGFQSEGMMEAGVLPEMYLMGA